MPSRAHPIIAPGTPRDRASLRRNHQWTRVPHRSLERRDQQVARPDRAGARRFGGDNAVLWQHAVRSRWSAEPVARARSREIASSTIVARWARFGGLTQPAVG